MAIAPAKATNPLTILPQDISPSDLSTGANIPSATAATIKAAEPARLPFIKYNPPASMPNEPPSATNPLAISSHDIPLNEVNAFPRIVIATATPIRPMALTIMPLGIRFIAPTIISNAPPIAARPLAISSHDI